MVQHTDTSVVTIERYIIEQEQRHPQATGELSGILYDLALAAKMITNKVRNAGLADVIGATAYTNVHGETQQKLDVLANDIIIKAMDHGGRLCAMASEEEPGVIPIPENFRTGKYVLLFDPLDGSSNIDVNVPVGTIFSVLRKVTRGPRGRAGGHAAARQAAGGRRATSSTARARCSCTRRARVRTGSHSIRRWASSCCRTRTFGFRAAGAICRSTMPTSRTGTSQFARSCVSIAAWTATARPLSVRYVGSLVADFHRNLLGGGIFAYPPNRQHRAGKLRLLYEVNPLAFIVEQAGGGAIDGTRDVLDVQPSELHQRTPLYIGSMEDVALARRVLAGQMAGAGA